MGLEEDFTNHIVCGFVYLLGRIERVNRIWSEQCRFYDVPTERIVSLL